MRGSFSSFSRFKGFYITVCRSPAGRAPLYAEKVFGIQRYSSLFPLREQNAALRIARSPHRKSYADHSGDTRFSECNITTPRRERQTLRTASGGQERPAASGGGHDGVLSCGRKRERIPDRTHVLAHERMHEYEHPRTASCRQERKRASAHARLPASLHGFMQTIMSSSVHAPLLSRLNTAGNTIKYCLQRRYSASSSNPARSSGRPERTSSKMSVRGGRRRTEIKQRRFDSYKKRRDIMFRLYYPFFTK